MINFNFSNMSRDEKRLQMSNAIRYRLLFGFYRLYPALTREFEKILDDRPVLKNYLADEPSRISFYKNEVEIESRIRERQNNCLHDYESPILIDKLKIAIWKCKKCRFEKIEKSKKRTTEAIKRNLHNS